MNRVSFKSILMPLFCVTLLAACEQIPELKDLPSFVSLSERKPVASSVVAPKIEAVETAGFKTWLVEDKSQPLFSVHIVFEGAGSISDPVGREGRAMFAAALLDEGAGNMDALAFQKALDDKAIELGIETDEDALIITMRSLSANKEEAFRLLGLALTQPRFDEDAVARKRKKAFSTLVQSEKNPSYILSKRFKELGYPNHTYGRPELGTKSSLTKLSAADFKKYITSSLAKNNITVSVAGDIDAASLAILLNQNLSALPSATAFDNPVQKTALQNAGRLEIIKQPIPQSLVLFGTPAIDRKDPQFMAGYVFNQIIGGDTLTSRLGKAIREQRGLAYSVNTSLNPMTYSSTFGGMFATRNDQVKGAYDALLEVSADIQNNGVTAEDLQRAKDYLTGSFSRALVTNAELTNYLSIMQRYDLGIDYLQKRNAKIEVVTLEEVNALAKTWLKPENWLVVIVGSPEKFESGRTTQAPSAPLAAPVVQSGKKIETETKPTQPAEETSETNSFDELLSIFAPTPMQPPAPKPAADSNLNTHSEE